MESFGEAALVPSCTLTREQKTVKQVHVSARFSQTQEIALPARKGEATPEVSVVEVRDV